MKELNRDYTMSDADLMMLASKLVMNMTRDAVEFLSRGVTALDITDLEALGNAFEVFPPDGVYVGELKDATTAKNDLRDTVTDEIQLISGFFEQKWGADSGKYTSLTIKGLHNATDSGFLLAARVVVDQATAYLADLTPVGLTQALIDTLETDAQSMEDAIVVVINKKELRDEKAHERTTNGNALYAFAAEYSKVGKLIWENVNEAKYNDYVIYPSTAQMPGKVLNMGYDLPTRTVSWDTAPYAEDYQLERKYSSDPDWTVVYEGADTSVVNDPVTAGTWYYRCRGQNENGYGTWSDELTVIMPV